MSAAAVVDPTVEWLSNHGAFGPGAFTDHSTLDVAPALIIGLLLAAAFVAALVRRTIRPSARYAPDWLRRFAGASTGGAALRLFPAVFAVQLIALWSMETLEQIVVAGRPLGGTLWLGGPVVISLLLHALGCAGSLWAFAKALRWSAATIVDVVRYVRQLLCRLRAACEPSRRRFSERPSSRFLEPILARLKGRAPPYRLA